MTDEQILSLIQTALCQAAPKRASDFEHLTLDKKLDALGLDSIAIMEMVGFVEEHLDVTFNDEELTEVEYIHDLARLIRKHATTE